jgi:hypothetical protein
MPADIAAPPAPASPRRGAKALGPGAAVSPFSAPDEPLYSGAMIRSLSLLVLLLSRL